MVELRTAVVLAVMIGLWPPSGVVLAQYGDWPAAFDPLELLTLNLDMDPGDWVTVQNDNPYDEQPQIEVPAWFWADGEDAILISVRRKPGDPLTEVPGFIKVSLKLDINEYVIGQSWHGLKKLSLENGDDEDVVTEGLAWQVERLASGTQGYGYQAGHFAWVRLLINGVDTGVYVNVEQRDKRFLENRDLYTEGETWLYKKGELGPAELEVGGPLDSPTTEALCFSPFNTESPCTPDPDLVTATEQWVNVKGLLALMANDAFQGNGDALFTKGKNYYYADFLTGRKRMYFPWDRDSSFSEQAVTEDIYSGGCEYDALINEAEFRAQYNQIFNDLVCGPWSTASLTSFLDAVEPVLTDALAADPNNQFGGDVADHFDGLRTFVTDRVSNVIGQIEGFQPCPSIQVDLNEFMASNAVFIEDPDEPGEFPDWFELHNPSASEVDLGGLYVTDDVTFPTKWQIDAGVTIPGNGYLLFWADEDPEQGPLHANLKLGAGGEELYVFDTNGVTVIDSIVFGAQVTDVSYGRYPDGAGGWGFMATPTPGAANSPHNAPPAISGTTRTPELPTDVDPVWVTSTVTDDSAVVSVTLSYYAGGWIDTAMYDDGAHNDGGAGDDVYGGQIPAFGDGSVVEYYVTAIDDLGAIRVDPINAPALPYSYYVGYDMLLLYINEFMADNDNFIEDPDQPLAYEDWVELYNAGPSPIDLGGMYLTDDLQNPVKYQIPAGVSIAGDSYLVFWMDDDIEQGPLHTNFKLSAVGEEIGLFDTDAYGNMPIDTLAFGQQFTDTSQGRCPDATENWQLFSLATPEAPNGPCGTEQQACCLPGLSCDDLDLLSCVSSGGIAQGTDTECATVTCPECIIDMDCNDDVSCTADACNEATGVCSYTPFDAVCDNGLFCDGSERCDALAGCQAGINPCPGQACDEPNDICVGDSIPTVSEWGTVVMTLLMLAAGTLALDRRRRVASPCHFDRAERV
ncbi:MAG: IPTL-CTERM sorting domain-containing protein [Phycisphaerales bacterium]|nr:MAG: IPTL-CTERM sorting domain-containing protein [Phycisphaerales bacterium]